MNSPPHGLPRKDPAHLRYVRSLRCCLTGKLGNVVPHHVRLAGTCGTSCKPSDWLTVPVDSEEHTRIHTEGTTPGERAKIHERLLYLLIEKLREAMNVEVAF